MFVYVQPEQMNRGLVTQTLKRIRGSEGLNRSATVNLGATRQTNMSHEWEQRMMSVAHAKTACAFIGHARHKTVVAHSRKEHVYPTKRSVKATVVRRGATSACPATRSGSPRGTMAATNTSKESGQRRTPNHRAAMEDVRYSPSPLGSRCHNAEADGSNLPQIRPATVHDHHREHRDRPQQAPIRLATSRSLLPGVINTPTVRPVCAAAISCQNQCFERPTFSASIGSSFASMS